ncbi:uncharacterized protein CC84DRAFT_1208143 [Paraphaeosphaeria sporulosa]|uniref:Mid2 domain-containing protein n=1 Tax=Paraphaeosphaeria sporulosa TaxID=1460663 RepID=A0A177C532_9PLEO|nr:uncharacterized protein CC84DRAFT_1208143 [Paraphaeosphaeria sporulosa]OAG02002.1 hypothetical protein CC84DRAFT_1208143 [Paraphaeosphaeria sporulosa]
MFRAARLLQALVYFATCTTLVIATCYTPDGNAVQEDDVAPCSNDPSDPLSHICCITNRPKASGTSTNASEIRDTCLPNGLCQNESLLEDGSIYLQWGRNWCTNPDWSTGQCLDDVCTRTAGEKAGLVRVIPCSGKNSSLTWCCGDSDSCCTSTDQTDLVSLAPTFTTAAATSTSSASSSTLTIPEFTPDTSIIVTTRTSSSDGASQTGIENPQVTPAETSGLPRGAKAGIAIGAVVGAVVFVMLGVWISKAMAWRRDVYAARAQNDPNHYTGSDMEGLYGQHPQKLPPSLTQ